MFNPMVLSVGVVLQSGGVLGGVAVGSVAVGGVAVGGVVVSAMAVGGVAVGGAVASIDRSCCRRLFSRCRRLFFSSCCCWLVLELSPPDGLRLSLVGLGAIVSWSCSLMFWSLRRSVCGIRI